MLIKDEIKAAVEALLFVKTDGMAKDELVQMLNLDSAELEEILQEMILDYAQNHRGLQIVAGDLGYVLCTKPDLAELINRLQKPAKKRLSPAAVETLAVIAYQQPITKGEVEKIRGVRIDKVIHNLLERELIAEVGHKEVLGKPALYATTAEFLKLFGLLSLKELPPLKEN